MFFPASISFKRLRESEEPQNREKDPELKRRTTRKAYKMQLRVLFSLVLVLFVVLMTGSSEAGRNKKEKGKKSSSACREWQWGACEPASGDCGTGLREGTCKEKGETKTVKCKVPCNWKKQFGGDCKYKFGNWGECDTETGLKTRNGTLKKALFNAECEQSVNVTKSCDKSKSKSKGKKGKKGM